MIVTIGDKHFVRGQSRLFMTIWLAIHLTDAMAMAGLAVRRTLDLESDKQAMGFSCSCFPLEMLLPIVHPMKLTVSNTDIDHIIIEIKAKGSTPMPGTHNISKFTEMHFRFVGIIYLTFYEQTRLHIQAKFGGDTQKWPQIFQFAWVLRNGIAHHGGRVNFTNPNYPSVTWQVISYSPADNGKPIFGPHFSFGDLLVFLFDLSDELDLLAIPLPID